MNVFLGHLQTIPFSPSLFIALGYMNNKRLSNPNLPSVPKPFKLLLQRGYAEPISSLTYRIPL